MTRQPSPAGQSAVSSDGRSFQKPDFRRRSRSANFAGVLGVDRSSSSTTSSSADSTSHTDGSLGQSDKMSEHQTVLQDEIHRLTSENASLQLKLDSSAAPLSPEPRENGGAQSGLREQNKNLANENSRLQEQVAQLERRILTGKAPLPVQGKDDDVTEKEKGLSADLRRLRAENNNLVKENQRLSYEIYQVNKVATIVASRVAKVLVGARRSSNFNTALVTELKRWNRKLEYENNRLYEIIDKLSSGSAPGLSAELKAKSNSKGQESAQLVRRLEDQNRNLQEEINRLSTDTAIMQSMAVRGDSDASPRAPSDSSSALSSLPASDETRQHSPNKHGHSRPPSGAESEASAELLEDLQNENMRLTAEVAKLQEELKAFKERNAALADKARHVEELTQANSKLQQDAQDYAPLAEENDLLKEEVKRLTSCLTRLEAKVALVTELDEENKRAFEEVAALNQELASLRGGTPLAEELEEQARKHQDEVKLLTSELVQLRSQKARGQFSSQQQKQLEENVHSLTLQVTSLQNSLEHCSAEAASLRSKQVYQEHLEKKLGQQQEELSQLQAQLAEAQARAAHCEGLHHANTRLQHEISKAQLDLDSLERKAAAAAGSEALHGQVRDLQVELAALSSQHAAAVDAKRALEDKQALMTQELNELRLQQVEAAAAAASAASSGQVSALKSLQEAVDEDQQPELDAGILAAYVEGLEAGQPLPHLATENRALQDMHKQLAGWISDIRQRKSLNPDEALSLTTPSPAQPSPAPPSTAPASPAPQGASSKGRMAQFLQRTNPNRTSRETRVRELLRVTSQALPRSPSVPAGAAASPRTPLSKPEGPTSLGLSSSQPEELSPRPSNSLPHEPDGPLVPSQQQPSQQLPSPSPSASPRPAISRRSPFSLSAEPPAESMPALAPVVTKRAESTPVRSAGAETMMQLSADRQAATAYQKFRGTNDVASFLMTLGYGGHIKPDQELHEVLAMALTLTHRDQLAIMSAWDRARATATHAKLKQWWVGEVGTQLPILD